MAHNGVIADHINRLIRDIHGPEDRGLVRQRVNEFLAIFDPPGGMAIAEPFMRNGHHPGAIPGQHGLGECLNRGSHRGGIAALGLGGSGGELGGSQGSGPGQCQVAAFHGHVASSCCGNPQSGQVCAREMRARKAQTGQKAVPWGCNLALCPLLEGPAWVDTRARRL